MEWREYEWILQCVCPVKCIVFSRVWVWGRLWGKLQYVCQFSQGQIEKTGLAWCWVLRMNHQPTREGSQRGAFLKIWKSEKNYKLKPSSSTSSSCSYCCCHLINNIIIAITIQTVTIIINPITKWITNIFITILIILIILIILLIILTKILCTPCGQEVVGS